MSLIEHLKKEDPLQYILLISIISTVLIINSMAEFANLVINDPRILTLSLLILDGILWYINIKRKSFLEGDR